MTQTSEFCWADPDSQKLNLRELLEIFLRITFRTFPKKTSLIPHLPRLLGALLLSVSVTACRGDSNEMIGGDVSGYNYATDFNISTFSVIDPETGNIAAGPNVFAKRKDQLHGGGQGFMCCAGYPREWRPGLWREVVWLRERTPYFRSDPEGQKWFQARAQMPPYKGTAGLVVKFLPGDRIRLHVISGDPRPDGTYENPDVPPAENDPYIVQGIPDAALNAELAADLAERLAKNAKWDKEQTEIRAHKKREASEALEEHTK